MQTTFLTHPQNFRDIQEAISYNELGYTTLSVAEPRRGVSVGAPSCDARSVTEDNVPLGRARAKVPSGACQPQLYAVLIYKQVILNFPFD